MIQLVTLSVVLAVILRVQSQSVELTTGRASVGNCPTPDLATVAALIPESFSLGDSTTRPVVNISEMMIVCEATGLTRNTINSFSVVVSYTCTGGVQSCDGSARTEQFQYDCNSDDTYTEALIAGGILRTVNITGTLMTPLNEECGRCIAPDSGVPTKEDDHCAACTPQQNCNEGQMRCATVSTTSGRQCCNWYLNDTCLVTCPEGLVGDTEAGTVYDCGCGQLTLEFGMISYSNRFAFDSTATHSCDEGFELSGNNNQRMCSMQGWTEDSITCIEIEDIDECERAPPPCDVNAKCVNTPGSFLCECNDDFKGDGITCEKKPNDLGIALGLGIGIPLLILVIIITVIVISAIAYHVNKSSKVEPNDKKDKNRFV